MRMRLLIGALVTAALATGAAVQAPARAPNGCSKATAVRIAAQRHWTTGGARVGQVLCGPFLGAGSRAMAVTLELPSCGGNAIEWAVFGRRSGSWRPVLHRRTGAILSVTGTDLRERVGVPAAGDPRCSPSGWKSRTWHWDGTRLVASAWRLAAANPAGFLSPDRTVWCTLGDAAWCGTMHPDYTAELSAAGTLTLCTPSIAAVCTQNWDDAAPVLELHATSVRGAFRCSSEVTGIACTVASGRGFLINSGGITRLDA